MESPTLDLLLIEDDPDHAELIQDTLGMLHEPVAVWTWVRTLEEGIARLKEARFDAVLSDLSLPDSTLADTVLRLEPHAGSVPMIVLTSLNDMDVALRAVRQGAQDYLVKTQLSSELLLRTIRHAIERSRHSEEMEQINALLRGEVGERRDAQEALRQINETLEQRVAERTRELERVNQTLEARNKELEEFTYAASHDLQEPLRKVSTFASLLSAEHQSQLDDDGRHYVERIQSASARMSKLLSDLLVFSDVMTKAVPFRTVDLNDTLGAVLSDLEVPMRDTGGRVVTESLPPMEGDPVQLHQLLLNLISNGLRFHRKGEPPVVRVSGSVQEGSAGPLVKLTVEDNGIGFDLKYIKKIFMPFQRLHGKGEYDGTGMGLAVCRRIVERHGGEITAESTPGAGSRFMVLLPQHEVPPAQLQSPLAAEAR